MYRIGILGDIGSGKSFVSKFFKYPIFDADKEIVKIYFYNKDCYKKLKKNFPNYIKRFPVDKKEIIRIILDDSNNLKKLGRIIHPFVNKELNKFLKKNKKKNLVLDIPLLLENKIRLSKLIYVFISSKKADILKKIRKRPNFNKKIYNIMKKNQLPLSYKKQRSHFIIKNNFMNKAFLKQINYIKKEINTDDRSRP